MPKIAERKKDPDGSPSNVFLPRLSSTVLCQSLTCNSPNQQERRRSKRAELPFTTVDDRWFRWEHLGKLPSPFHRRCVQGKRKMQNPYACSKRILNQYPRLLNTRKGQTNHDNEPHSGRPMKQALPCLGRSSETASSYEITTLLLALLPVVLYRLAAKCKVLCDIKL